MEEWITLGPADMVQPGTMQEVRAGERSVLLAHIGEHYYAVQARCPHLRAHLARGTLEGTVVTCPAHGSRFDLRTGQAASWIEGLPGMVRTVAQAFTKPKDLATFEVKVEKEQIWIRTLLSR